MKAAMRVAVFAILSLLVLASCQLGVDPLATVGGARGISLPSGAQLLSARLVLRVDYWMGDPAVPQEVTVHRVLSDWDEETVTWNTFGAAYDPVALTSFFVSGPGEYEVDLTAVVVEWIGGLSENHGVLLRQRQDTPAICFGSSENANTWGEMRPALKLTYVPEGGSTGISLEIRDSDGTNDIPDATIWTDGTGGWWEGLALGALEPYRQSLFTGMHESIEKQSLIGFDLLATPEGGCTRTIGYWKNHAGLKSQADMISSHLPIWLGNPPVAGEVNRSLLVSDRDIAVKVLVMKSYGNPSNGITKLYAQLLAAKLNIASGAGGGAVAGTVADAAMFLAAHDHLDWARLSATDRQMVLDWMSRLDAYNNGILGPGHCVD